MHLRVVFPAPRPHRPAEDQWPDRSTRGGHPPCPTRARRPAPPLGGHRPHARLRRRTRPRVHRGAHRRAAGRRRLRTPGRPPPLPERPLDMRSTPRGDGRRVGAGRAITRAPNGPSERDAPRGEGSGRRRRRRKGRGAGVAWVRHPTGRRSRQAATAEAGPGRAPRPGAAPHGARVQTGSNGRGGGGAGGAPGCGAPRGGGSSRRRRWERAQGAFIVSPCTAGESGAERRRPIPPRRCEGVVSARPDHRHRAGGAACAPARRPGRRVPASSTPRGPHTPSPVTHSDRTGVFAGEDSGIPPPLAPLPGFRPPLFPPSSRLASSITAPAQGCGGQEARSRPGLRAPTSPRRRGGAQGTPPHPYCPCSRRPEGFRWSPAGRPQPRGDAGAAPRPAARDHRPSHTARPRRPLEPPPRGAPHLGAAPAPALPLPSPPV